MPQNPQRSTPRQSSSPLGDFSQYVGAKMPPCAPDIERAVLGALMLQRDLALDLHEFLKAEHFYDPNNQAVYQAITDLILRNQAVDLLTVRQQLTDMELLEQVGGAPYLASLTGMVASGVHAVEHAKIVIQKYLQRELIRLCAEVQASAYDGQADVDDLIEEAEQRVFELHEFGAKKESESAELVLKRVMENIEKAKELDQGLSGLPTGFDNLDEMTQGWQKGDLIIIAARPSMGKTAFVLTMARNMALKYKASIAFFSLEMPNEQLLMRLLVAESKLDSKMVRAGKLRDDEWVRLSDAVNTLAGMRIRFDDTQALGIGELRSKARRLKTKYNIDLIIIDYLQLMTAPYNKQGNREQEVNKISNSLKALAKELDIPIVALAQMNRASESRTEKFKRPILSDLRESGAIEQDADIVAFIHRPEYYGIPTYNDGTSTDGMAELIIRKNRNGETGTLFLQFVPHLTQFNDIGDRKDHYQEAGGDTLDTPGAGGFATLQSKANTYTAPALGAGGISLSSLGNPNGTGNFPVSGEPDNPF